MTISYSSTIINLLLKNKESNFEIYVLESRPLLEGQRVAETLSPHFKTHLIIDAAIGTFIDEIVTQSKVSSSIIDSIFNDYVYQSGDIPMEVRDSAIAILAEYHALGEYNVE